MKRYCNKYISKDEDIGKGKKTTNKAPQEKKQREHRETRTVQREKTADHKQSEKKQKRE